MTKRHRRPIARTPRGFLVAAGVLLLGCGGQPQSAQPVASAPAVTPKVSVNAVMVGLVDHAAQEIWWAAQPDKGPKTDRDWTELQSHAWQLAASGPVLAAGGTGQLDSEWSANPAWRGFSQQLTDVGAAAVTAVANRDTAAISKVGDELLDVCQNCHTEFKLPLPTGGFMHPPYRQ